MRPLRSALVLTLCAGVAFAGVPALAAAPKAAPRGVEIRVGQAADFSRIEFHGLQPRSNRREGRDLVFRFPTATVPDVSRLTAAPLRYLKSARGEVKNGGYELRLTLADDGAAKLGQDGGAAFVNLMRDPAAPPTVQDQRPRGRPNPVPLTGALPFKAEKQGQTVKLSFAWRAPLGAAVFRRGEAIWVVFDSPAALDLTNAPRGLPQIRRMEAVPGAKVAAVRILADPEVTASAAAEGGTWTISLAAEPQSPSDPVKLGRDDHEGPAALNAQLAGATGVFWLKDPSVGDRIAAVTALAPSKGLQARRILVDAALPATVQGLVVEPQVEDLTVAAEGDLVRIGRPRGLALSPAVVRPRGAPALGLPQPAGLPALVDFAAWSKLGEGGFSARYDALVSAAAEEAAKGRAGGLQARLALARFLIGSELAHEGIGVLNMAAKADGTLAGDPEFRGLRGAARAMIGRYAEAQADFSSPALANDPSSALWRGYIAVKLGDMPGARQAFASGRGVMGRFSPVWRTRFAAADAEAAIKTGDLKAAAAALAVAEGQQPQGVEADRVMLERARFLDASGQKDPALALYDRASRSPYGAVAAPALQRALEIRLDGGKISPAQAVEGLDSLRFRWRGDATELETIRTLGRIYLGQGRYRDALTALRSAGRRLPDLPMATALQTDLATSFRALFLGGAADGLEPIQALGLFYDFKELTPVGADGDMMVRRLARRLVDVDLLDQAAELLKYQAENRLDGVPRAEVSTDLAMIQLMNRQPELALQAINSSRTTLLPSTLNAERRLVEARALLSLGRYDHALEVLGKDASAEAREIRGEIAWKQQDWAGAGSALEAGLGDRWKSAAPLSADEEDRLLRAATAYSLAENNAALTRLRSRYAKLTAAARRPEALRVALTGGGDNPGVTSADFARTVTDADALAGWVDRMKKRFRERPAPTARS